MKSYGSYTPSNFLSPAAPLRFTVDSSIEYIRIQNNSSYDLQLEMGGMEQITYPARQLEDIKISQKSGTFNGQITVVPIATVTNISAGTANVLWFYTFTKGELAQPQILQLVAPAVNPTASGKPLFTASFGSGGTTTIGQYLNVFNPPGSGVNMIFHKARVFTNDATFPTVNLYIVPGADLNLGTPVSAVSHSAKVTPPVSAAHCTAVDSGSNFISANTGDIEVMDMQAGVTQDMLAFPDNVVLYPGNNLTMLLVSGTTGHIVRMSLAYTEDIFSPQFGGTNLGT